MTDPSGLHDDDASTPPSVTFLRRVTLPQTDRLIAEAKARAGALQGGRPLLYDAGVGSSTPFAFRTPSSSNTRRSCRAMVTRAPCNAR